MKKRIIFVLRAIPPLILIFLLFNTCTMMNKIIFHPPVPEQSLPNGFHIQGEGVPEPGVSAVYLISDTKKDNKMTILYSHGNAEDLSRLYPYLQDYNDAGYDILAYDYEGYGLSGGKPTEKNTYRDIKLCWDYLVDRQGISPDSIAIMGRSVGTGPAVWLATQVKARALVLEAPFTSIFAVANLGWIPGSPFPSLKRIGKIHCPLMIVHGSMDTVIPIKHGRKLFETATVKPKVFLEVQGADHNDAHLIYQKEYWDTMKKFLKDCAVTQENPGTETQ